MKKVVEDLNIRFKGFSIKEAVKCMCIWAFICIVVGVFCYAVIKKSEEIVFIIILSSLIGMVIGSVIYVVAIRKAKGWQLLFEIVLLMTAIHMIFSISPEIENKIIEYLPAYVGLVSGVFVVVYAINTIRQILMTMKLNRELKHKD